MRRCVMCLCVMCVVSLCVYNTNMQQQNDIATPTTAKNNKNILTAIVIIYYIYIYMIAIDICIRFYRWTLVKRVRTQSYNTRDIHTYERESRLR